jgi:peptide-methionine (R)-S-oxide reductase
MANHKKTEQEWKEKLTPEQFRVCRQKGTEPPFTGEYNDSKTPGIYRCACCGAELFRSEDKFESGTGWPSFVRPANEDNVATETDTSYGMRRTEVLCGHCHAHLGHVFPDGPRPSGLRYCINSVSLKLDEKEE